MPVVSVVQTTRLSRRDLHLLRHMLVMICIFLGGWTPLFIALWLQTRTHIDQNLLATLAVWCELALLCDIIDLHLYNREVRDYLWRIFFRQHSRLMNVQLGE